jgi:D-3-phosphoglycerate dehydrogenase
MPRLNVVLVVNDLPPTPDWVAPQLAALDVELAERLCANPAEVAAAAKDADVIWLMGGACVVSAGTLPELRQCRVILRTGTGTDNIPVAAATRQGIIVANTPEATMHQVAEHALGLLFAVVRQIPAQDRLVRQGIWDRRRAWPSWHFVDQVLGLVGFGRIAQLVARKASGLEMKIIACDPLFDQTAMAAHGVEKVELDELLGRADFVSIHVPLMDQTYHLIGEAQLRRMKPPAVLVNTSRGKIIDEKALIRALTEGWIAAAGLDVVETEPPAPDNPLLHLDNVVLTPHIASYSDVFYERFWSHSVRTLVEMVRNGLPIWIVNRDVKPWWQAGSR